METRDVFPLLFVYMATVEFFFSLSLARERGSRCGATVPPKGFRLMVNRALRARAAASAGSQWAWPTDDQSLISTAVFAWGSD